MTYLNLPKKYIAGLMLLLSIYPNAQAAVKSSDEYKDVGIIFLNDFWQSLSDGLLDDDNKQRSVSTHKKQEPSNVPSSCLNEFPEEIRFIIQQTNLTAYCDVLLALWEHDKQAFFSYFLDDRA